MLNEKDEVTSLNIIDQQTCRLCKFS